MIWMVIRFVKKKNVKSPFTYISSNNDMPTNFIVMFIMSIVDKLQEYFYTVEFKKRAYIVITKRTIP